MTRNRIFPKSLLNRILLFGILILCMIFVSPLSTINPPHLETDTYSTAPLGTSSLSSTEGNGTSIISQASYSRVIEDLEFSLVNSFTDTESHEQNIDLSPYHIAGWSLYEAVISTTKVVALAEREIIGSRSNPSNSLFNISEYDTDVYYDQLAQGFYDMGHDGILENISLLYDSSSYDPLYHNYAYFDIRSDYADGSTNMVSSVPLANVGLTPTWATISESTILSADTLYYAILNGSKLVEVFTTFPVLTWYYQDSAGSYETRRHSSEFVPWSSDRPFEALINYTYTPWNTTSNSAHEFSDPLEVDLQGNSTPLTSSQWIFNSLSNITQIQFTSNQSLSVKYGLILRYKQSISSSSSWYAEFSGSDITWNVTTTIDYPDLSGSQNRNLTIQIPSDWIATHLFNTTSPTQYYDHFSQDGSNVNCIDLADETWILECTSPNYLQSLSMFDASDDSIITQSVSVSVIMDINATIEDAISNPVTNGNAHVRVSYQNNEQFSEDYSVTSGISHHQWDISTDSSSNGLHSIELYWMNGTEVGYRTSDVIVFYETSLVADEYTIDAFTNDTFYIGIDFNQIFPAGGIDASAAAVTYSFGSVMNQSLDDQSNGRWDATVSTSSMTPETYNLYIYAEGYGLENKSLTLQVTLIHETANLIIQWSNSNNISYVQTTDLLVAYQKISGENVTDASVTVTVDGSVLPLKWDIYLNYYRITFNGTEGFGNYSLVIQASKIGYEPQSNDLHTLILHEEYTDFSVLWTNGYDITYVENTILKVSYTMTSSSSSIPFADVNVTDGITTWILKWNSSEYNYQIRFNGTDSNPGFGMHNLTIKIGKLGYENHESILNPLTLREEPTSLTLSWSNGNNISYIQTTTLVLNYTMSDGTPVEDAIINVTIGSGFWELTMHPISKTYNLVLNGNDVLLGFSNHSVIVKAEKIGFYDQINATEFLTVNLESTVLTIDWSSGFNITYIHQTTLSVTYKMSNNVTLISGAIVNVTIDGQLLNLTWDGASYTITFNGTDNFSGFNTYDLTILASRYGFVGQTDIDEDLILRREPTSIDTEWLGTSTITFVGSTIVSVNYTMSSGAAITGAVVYFTIDSKTWNLTWDETSKTYRREFFGTEEPPGLGNHSYTIEASRNGFITGNDSGTLTINPEPTTVILTWSNTNRITYINSTTLIANFTQSDGSPVIGATVNVTVGTGFWPMNWNNQTFVYELTFNGTDSIPGFGTFNVTVLAGDTGFVDRSNDNQSLIVSLESTSITITWTNTGSITFVQQTTLIVSFKMSNNSVIPIYATVNVTIGEDRWDLEWDNADDTYRVTFLGSYAPPGLGTHNLTIRVGMYGYENHVNSNETLTLSIEPTSMTWAWLDSSTITYLGSTILIINYTYSDGTPVTDAIVNATIGTFPEWDIVWDEGTSTYRVTFFGDEPPGFGTHNITIRADKFGYESRIGLTNITLVREPTYLIVWWIPDNDITYLTSSILVVSYRMSDSTPISGAVVNVTYGSAFWPLKWSNASQDYRLQINGSDVAPGFGNFTLNIQASKNGFDEAANLTQWVLIRVEPTNLNVQWASGNNPDFYSYTYLIVEYLYDGSSSVMNATLNVSINSYTFDMEWNSTEGYYQLRINGSDSYLGVGTNSITISAGTYGFETQINGSEVIIPVVPTKLVLVWAPSDTITYLEHTTLQAHYTIYNDALILGASVNVTINGITLPLTWSSSSNSYEITFYGTDSALGIATFSILVEAVQDDFQIQSNSTEELTIQLEPTVLVISWIGEDNITYFEQTTLSVQFNIRNGTPISTGILNATINGFLWNLEYNAANEAYEATILGNDVRLAYDSYNVTVNASGYGYVSLVNSSQTLTIRLEDTYLAFEWVPLNTISFLDSTVFRIYYRYTSDNSSVIGATVNATYLSTWVANYNNDSKAYEIIFTGSDFPTPILGTHTLSVAASKANHLPLTDNLQEIMIVKESTYIESWWLDGDNTITYVENTTIFINYSIAVSGISIEDANVTVRIGTTTWNATYNSVLDLYYFTFTGDLDPPGLGSYVLFISASYNLHEGYQDAEDNSKTLEIKSATVEIDSYWLTSGTITYLQQTTLVVNYTLTSGESIPLAQVNVTINQTYWFALWDEVSETYRLTFNGTDALPGLGFHELNIRANRTGFDPLKDDTLRLNITQEPTVLIPRWSNPHQNNITYFEYTYLFVDYLLANTTPITFATVSVTIGSDTWILDWNDGESAYGIRFNGTDEELGFGFNSLTITALKHGYEFRQNMTETLELLKDPTTIQITWSNGNETTYVGSTTLIVQYRMSNTTPISTGTITATIGTDVWLLDWNASAEAYYVVFAGNMSLPGLGTFSVQIEATGVIFATQLTSESLIIREEPTSANASWITATIDWTESIILGIDYKDTYGHLINDATQKTITIDGSTYTLQGTNGTYWRIFDNSFDLGHHVIVVNISKFGYEFAVNASISFDIVEAATDITAIWADTTIDYAGHINLTVDYTYLGTGESIPVGLVQANITIDGTTTLNLTQSGDLWTITLNGDVLDLGSHSVLILVQAYGYTYAAAGQTLTVNEVSTISSGLTWIPSNLTIEYTDSLILVVDYTYAGGDVPDTASVNVTIEGLLYELHYSAGAWRISILGRDLGIGVFDADITAWLYGYELRTFVTTGINVTGAANLFAVSWEPLNLTPTYVDQVNLTVGYDQDGQPIENATIRLYINGTMYDLDYSEFDKMWYFSISAATIDLGIWNVTITANKTGYTDGFYTGILTVVIAPTVLDVQDSGGIFYYDETATVDIFYQMSNLSAVPGSVISFTLNSIEQNRTWNSDHWSTTINGTELGVGVFTYTIVTSAYGYETKIDTLEITILSIPTLLIMDADISIYAHESVSFRFTYFDDRTSTAILATEFVPVWSEFYNMITLPNNTYVVTIGGNDFHVGNYTFQLTLGRLGFDNSTGAIDIEVYPIPTQFVDPLVITIVIGGMSLLILALALRRRRKGGGSVSAPVSVAPVAPVTPPSSPLSEMEKRLRNEIATSEEGISRAELSRRLGPSASKIGAMVKDLLDSDSGFYEVREGAKKLIKFRNPDLD